MNNSKIQSAAKHGDTAAKICGSIFQAAGIVFFVFVILVAIFGKKMYEANSFSLDLDFVKLHLAGEYPVSFIFLQIYTILGLLVGCVFCFAACYGIRQLRFILEPMKTGRPFAENIPISLKKLAWTVLVSGIISQIAEIAQQILLQKVYPMEQIFSSSAIERIEYSYTIDFGFVFLFGIIMFLSCIFSYGQQLQKESDETL